jgi:phage gpG-like protein
MRSIKKQSATLSRVVVIADSDYADIHNNGGYITVTAQMKKYFWAKYYEFGQKGLKAEYCKGLALKEVGSKIKIPQHQFMGDSQTLMQNFDDWFGKVIRTQVEPKFNNPTINFEFKNV